MATEILRRCFVMSVLSGRVCPTFVNFKMDFMHSTCFVNPTPDAAEVLSN
jgi:hypothetical protein